jgi:predicted nucleic acid-binding protein
LAGPAYLDTSAIAKLVVSERESEALRSFLDERDSYMVSSQISEIELVRAVRRVDEALVDFSLRILNGIVLLPLTESMRLRARHLEPAAVRTLDALQLATALEIQTDLDCLVSYDRKLSVAAREAGLRVVAPETAD